jgi:hypothetical protein
MSIETLQTILRHVEGLELPDGEYLKIANGLKVIFEKENNKSIWTTINTPEINTIQIILNGCYTSNKVILNIKSVSASNVGIPGPTTFKFSIEVNIYKVESGSEILIKTYEIISRDGSSNRLETLLYMFGPKNVTIKLEELEITYECYKFLEEWKDRCIKENSLDEDNDEIDMTFTDNVFRDIMLNKINMSCKDWFWIRHNEMKEN